MIHSITFGGKNTWSDWQMIPHSQPVFAMPGVKTNSIEVPGVSGEIDLSDIITGYPLYSNRTGSFTFLVVDHYRRFLALMDEIRAFLHGQVMTAVLEDEPDWQYEGRFSIDEYSCDEKHGNLTISYNVGPYRWSRQAVNEPWKWDPFNFETGIIGNGSYTDPITGIVYQGAGLFTGVEISEATELSYDAKYTGTAPQQVLFSAADNNIVITISKSGTTVKTQTISAGSSGTIAGMVLYRGGWLYNGKPVTVSVAPASGTARLTMAFRIGRI